jgi:hypothetical protein
MSEKLKAVFVFELLGRPPEHLKKTLDEFVNKLLELDGIELVEKRIYEPKPLKDGKEDIYTTFAEVELLLDNLNLLFAIVLNKLPSNIEVIEPTSIKINNFDLSSVLSELATKLHRYDEVTKVLALERNNLMKQIKELKEKTEWKEKVKKKKKK